MQKVFLNDQLVDIENAAISVGDSGFLYGAGLFETMRAYNGVVFRLDDHLDRLLASAKALSIEHSCSKDYLAAAVEQVLGANNLAGARIRLTLSAGALLQSQDKPAATLLVTAANLEPYPAEYYARGIMVVLCPYRQNVTDPTCGHKTTNYFPRMLALKYAREKHAVEAVWFTTDGRLAEGCISSVFLVKNSIVFTPTLNTPVLPGIGRKTVCEIAKAGAIELIEKDLSIDDMLAADEIFLTNVIMQIMPVVAVEKHTVGEGRPGILTNRLAGLYTEFFKEHCGARK